jgi:hypothetical protein
VSTTHEALIVPVRVTALMVNCAVRSHNFRRWNAIFGKGIHHSPEPHAPTDPDHPSTPLPNDGVVVHWELPAALRTAIHKTDGTTTYPPVPNRWIVIRYSGNPTREATGWLVQSDCIRDDTSAIQKLDDNSAYVIKKSPNTPEYEPKRIGRVLKLNKELEENEKLKKTLEECPGSTTLTAVGPGLPTFSVYQPYNLGVFSLHDNLDGLSRDQPQRLSYLVMGWYSTDAHDPLADLTPGADFTSRLANRLARLGWDVGTPAELPTGTARTIYTGSILRVTWRKDRVPTADEAPANNDATKRKVTYGVAETSTDGVSALALAHNPGIWSNEESLRRLQALQYGLLHQLNSPDGRAAVQRRAHEARFEPAAGGYTWDFVTPSTVPGQPTTPIRPLPQEEQQWLKTINTDQHAYDRDLRELTRRQERLYELWWVSAATPNRQQKYPQQTPV